MRAVARREGSICRLIVTLLAIGVTLFAGLPATAQGTGETTVQPGDVFLSGVVGTQSFDLDDEDGEDGESVLDGGASRCSVSLSSSWSSSRSSSSSSDSDADSTSVASTRPSDWVTPSTSTRSPSRMSEHSKSSKSVSVSVATVDPFTEKTTAGHVPRTSTTVPTDSNSRSCTPAYGYAYATDDPVATNSDHTTPSRRKVDHIIRRLSMVFSTTSLCLANRT